MKEKKKDLQTHCEKKEEKQRQERDRERQRERHREKERERDREREDIIFLHITHYGTHNSQIKNRVSSTHCGFFSVSLITQKEQREKKEKEGKKNPTESAVS